MKSPAEIQAAHDRMLAVILGEVPNPFEGAANVALIAAADALCWVLDHCENPAMAENIAKLDRYLAQRGIVLQDTGETRTQ